MSTRDEDWLEVSLRSTRELLANLPDETKRALENEAKFQDVVRAAEQAAYIAKSDR